jgi:hypothetical protein
VTDTTPISPEAPLTPDAPETPEAPRPHTRWGAVVWGLIVILVGAAVLTVLSDRDRTAAFGQWLEGLTPGLVLVILVLVRRAQRASTDRGMR